MSSQPPSRVVIAGLGLVGGSLACALRRAWPDTAFAGWDDERVLAEGLDRGIVDAACRPDALEAGDLLVLAAPPMGSLYLLDAIDPAALPADVVITDVVSTKREMVAAASGKNLPFVGGHPMAGSDRSGIAYADAGLFAGARWFLVDAGAGEAAGERVEALARAAGAQPEWIEALEHDRLMAALSHLPQVAATALMAVAAELAGASNLDLAGPGLRDTTRLAGSGSTLWAQIAASNADELSRAIRLLRERLERAERALDAAEPLDQFFADGRRWRERL